MQLAKMRTRLFNSLKHSIKGKEGVRVAGLGWGVGVGGVLRWGCCEKKYLDYLEKRYLVAFKDIALVFGLVQC